MRGSKRGPAPPTDTFGFALPARVSACRRCRAAPAAIHWVASVPGREYDLTSSAPVSRCARGRVAAKASAAALCLCPYFTHCFFPPSALRINVFCFCFVFWRGGGIFHSDGVESARCVITSSLCRCYELLLQAVIIGLVHIEMSARDFK